MRGNRSAQRLEMEPDAHPWDPIRQTYSPISRIAEHVVIWHQDDLYCMEGQDTRTARDMRDQLSRYKRRVFAPAAEAGYFFIKSK